MKRLNMVTGHYGSGKTEFAINYALKLKDKFDKVTICDMDIVNPYFRTNDAKNFLLGSNVKLIAPEYANTNLDLPSLPSDILSVFSKESGAAVLDIGGDEDGAIALGQYYPHIKDEDYDMFLLVNTLRPDTACADDIVELANKIESASRCRITAIVNNTNLAYLSSVEALEKSIPTVCEAAEKMKVPVSFISGTKDILSKLSDKYNEKKFPLELNMKLPFDAMA